MIKHYLLITDSSYRESAYTIMDVARDIMSQSEDSNIISIIPIDTDSLTALDAIFSYELDGIIFCPHVKAGYIGKLLQKIDPYKIKDDIVIISNYSGRFIDKLEIIEKIGDIEDAFIRNVCTTVPFTCVYLYKKEYMKCATLIYK